MIPFAVQICKSTCRPTANILVERNVRNLAAGTSIRSGPDRRRPRRVRLCCISPFCVCFLVHDVFLSLIRCSLAHVANLRCRPAPSIVFALGSLFGFFLLFFHDVRIPFSNILLRCFSFSVCHDFGTFNPRNATFAFRKNTSFLKSPHRIQIIKTKILTPVRKFERRKDFLT